MLVLRGNVRVQLPAVDGIVLVILLLAVGQCRCECVYVRMCVCVCGCVTEASWAPVVE